MTLTDDETAPASITLTASPTSVGEDDGATTVTVTATLGGSATRPGATDVTVSVGGGTRDLGHRLRRGVRLHGDDTEGDRERDRDVHAHADPGQPIAEGDESIDVTGTATGFTVTKAEMTLTDDDTAPASITLTTSPTSVLESAAR